uniref:Uncharacterized protein n=1 Tax=Echinococcus canadensis TaxID=519352 RepID=A0A915ETV1_9CEST
MQTQSQEARPENDRIVVVTPSSLPEHCTNELYKLLYGSVNPLAVVPDANDKADGRLGGQSISYTAVLAVFML